MSVIFFILVTSANNLQRQADDDDDDTQLKLLGPETSRVVKRRLAKQRDADKKK